MQKLPNQKVHPSPLPFQTKGVLKAREPILTSDKAIAKRRLAARKGNGDELETFYVAVPSRPWRGLTVTGVGLHYERTSIYFGEPVAQVREVLRAIGVSIADNGSIPINNEEAVEVQALRTTVGEARRFGASQVECGI